MRGCRYIFYDDECVRVHLHTHLQYITFRKKRQGEREYLSAYTNFSEETKETGQPHQVISTPFKRFAYIHVIIFINWITANHRIAIRSDIPHIVVRGARKCGNPPWKNYEVISFSFCVGSRGEKTKQNVRWAARAEAILLSLIVAL
jgi:hypothetical protein